MKLDLNDHFLFLVARKYVFLASQFVRIQKGNTKFYDKMFIVCLARACELYIVLSIVHIKLVILRLHFAYKCLCLEINCDIHIVFSY